jgi:hypothetical protein
MYFLSNLSCVDSTLSNLFASFDFLHSCKVLIFYFYFFYKSVNVGYTFFCVISQDIVISDLMSKIVCHDVNKIQMP